MNQYGKGNQSSRLTYDDHRALATTIRPAVEDALVRYIALARKLPQTHKIAKLAKESYESMDRLRSALDDSICSLEEGDNLANLYY